MDSVTQAVLGGAVSYAILGRRLGRRAAIYGAALGTLPDLDVLIDFGGPIENMTYHRGFSHSFFVQGVVSPLLAWLFVRPGRLTDPLFVRWWLAIFLCFVTHSLADLFTVYGTQVLWPLSVHPFAGKSTFNKVMLNNLMLAVSTGYLIWSASVKVLVDDKAMYALQLQGISPTTYESTPAPFNTLLWRSVAIDGDYYYEIWTSIFDEVDQVQFRRYPRNLDLVKSVSDHPSVQRLQWFTKDQYKAWQKGDQIFLSDLRMGVEGAYVFNFEVAKKEAEQIMIGSFERLEQRPQLNRIEKVWQRIFDPSVQISSR
ncbi:MAG: metal-dependent hydrolase [Gammaproteobacteria bacterium]|nr:metal-dependent hydrolase [Gammaproteobacteria bacterium]